MTNGPNRPPTPRPSPQDTLTLFVPRPDGRGSAPSRRESHAGGRPRCGEEER